VAVAVAVLHLFQVLLVLLVTQAKVVVLVVVVEEAPLTEFMLEALAEQLQLFLTQHLVDILIVLEELVVGFLVLVQSVKQEVPLATQLLLDLAVVALVVAEILKQMAQ
jgi:hypothetical protein